MDQLLSAHPLPKDTEVLWFELPELGSPPGTSASAYSELRPKDEDYGLDAGRTWPITGSGLTVPEGALRLEPLDALERESTESDADVNREHFTVCASIALLTVRGMKATNVVSHLNHDRGVAVFLGFVSGDYIAVGQFSRRGWSALRVVKPSQPFRSRVIPDSVRCDPVRFLRMGGDPNSRDPKTGRTILLERTYDTPATYRMLLKAGADVRAVDNEGEGVLHRLGAVEISIFREFLARGASATLIAKNGHTVLDRIASDGRSTPEHLRLLLDRGATFRWMKEMHGTPLHEIAGRQPYNRPALTRNMRRFTFWMTQGYTLKDRNKRGYTPLWKALRSWVDQRMTFGVPVPKSLDHQEIAKLIELGADANERCRGELTELIPANATPLMVSFYPATTLVRTLLKCGANPMLKCSKGRTALDYARRVAQDPNRPDHKNAATVARWLEQAMGRIRSR